MKNDSPTRYLSEMLGQRGIFDCLQVLSEWGPGITADEIGRGLHGRDFDTSVVMDRLRDLGMVLVGDGGRLTLSTTGSRNLGLLRGLNGAPLADVVRALSMSSEAVPKYSLLVEGMTDFFVQALYDRPDFAFACICSPWLSFTTRTIGLLTQALSVASRVRAVQLY